jgi:hypothetical protein
VSRPAGLRLCDVTGRGVGIHSKVFNISNGGEYEGLP